MSLVLVCGAFAGIDLSFEASDTNLLQDPTFSGSTVGISNVTFDNQFTGDANDILDPSEGTPGVQCYDTSFSFDTDSPGTSFVRITDFADRHLLSEPQSSGGMGIYVKYDGAAGDVELSLTVREEPDSVGDPGVSADNEVYETFTPWATLSGSPDWQYFYFPFTQIVSDPVNNWGQSIALGDGVYDGDSEGLDVPEWEGIFLRPIPGTTSATVVGNFRFDDLHSGAQHTPLGAGPPDFSNPTFGVITQAEQEAAIGATIGNSSFALAGPGVPGLEADSDGTLVVIQDPSSGLGVVGELWDLDIDLSTATIVTAERVATEAEIVAGDPLADSSDQDIQGISVSGEVIYMLDVQVGDHISVVDRSTPSPTFDGIALTANTGTFDSETAIFPSLGTLVFADIIAGTFVQLDVASEVESTLISNATILSGTGGGGVGIDSQAGPKEIPGTTDFIWWDSDFAGGTGDLFQVTQGGAFTLLTDAASFPGGDPDFGNLKADSDGVVYGYITSFGGAGQGLWIRETDGTTHFFDAATIDAAVPGLNFGGDDRGLAVLRNGSDVLLLCGTSDTEGDIYYAKFSAGPTTTGVEDWQLYR